MRTLLALSLCLGFSGLASAQPKIDSEKLMFHVRETFNIPSGVDMKLGTPEKSEMSGLWKVNLTLSKGGQSQDRTLLVSEDGKHYMIAEVQDVSKLPDVDNLAKLNIKGAPSKGGQAAKVTVVEFTDFECPYCKRAHESIEDSLFKTYGDKVKLVFKHYPLTTIHPWSQSGGIAGACVAKLKPEAFWPFTDAMFKDQDGINQAVMSEDHRSADLGKFEAKVADIAAAQKVDRAKFVKCFNDKKEAEATVKADVDQGDSLGVNSTPTLFVNGHKLTGFGGFDQLKALIDEMLAGTHQPASIKND